MLTDQDAHACLYFYCLSHLPRPKKSYVLYLSPPESSLLGDGDAIVKARVGEGIRDLKT